MYITLGNLVQASGSPGYSPVLYVELLDTEGNKKGLYAVTNMRPGVSPDGRMPAAILEATEPDLQER